MRRSGFGRRSGRRPVALDIPVGVPTDNLDTWANTAQISTMSLPGTNADKYPLVVDVTNFISPAALSDVGALRFRNANGILLAHKRTPGNRILLIGNFYSGVNTIEYFWGKAGATQPGSGFLTADQALASYRLCLIFENGLPLDLSPNPTLWETIGTPTYESYGLGQQLKCAEGSYIQTTAPKLRGDARELRALFASITLPDATTGGRIVCWANWSNNQRAFQLWVRTDGLELYTSEDGLTFQRMVILGAQKAGPNTIGASWLGGRQEALLHCNDVTEWANQDFAGAAHTSLFDSSDPYIVGGTKVAGSYFNGSVRALFELNEEFKSEDHFKIWRAAWDENDVFWGRADRTPDSIDVPDLTGVPVSSEVAFPPKQVTGLSSGTPIAVYGDTGSNPSYSIGSSFSSLSDIKAKGSSPGVIGPENWLATYHMSANENSTLRETSVTIGTVTSSRRSTTVAATPGGGSSTPTGPADVFVSNASDLKTQFGTIQGGKILEIAAGDYKSYGTLELLNRDFRGGPPLVVRASSFPFRGYLASEGGLLVSGETFFQTGSGGAEFSGILIRNVHNVIFQGIRTYQGDVGKAGAKWSSINVISCTNLTFEKCKLCGYKPTTAVNLWAPDKYRADSGWWNQGYGIQMGINGGCDRITFRKSLIHFFGGIGIYNANSSNTLLEDCVFSDQMSDHIRNDGAQSNFTATRCILYRTWAVKGESGGIAHSDHCQNTTKTQSGWQNHYWNMCIFAPGDCAYPHIQGIFYECDNYPQYPRGSGVYVTNCLLEARPVNTIYNRPGDKLIVTKTMILQNQFGGLNELREDGQDSLIDTIFHTPIVSVSSTTGNGKSFGNNVIDRSIYYGTDLNTGIGDQIINSTQLLNSSYGTELVDYPKYNGPIRTTITPALPLLSAANWKQVKLLDSRYVLDTTQLARMAPKVNASIHPNQKGMHYGCSELFQHFGVLP